MAPLLTSSRIIRSSCIWQWSTRLWWITSTRHLIAIVSCKMTSHNLQITCNGNKPQYHYRVTWHSSIHYKNKNMGVVHGVVCLFTPQLLLLVIATTYGVTTRLRWPEWPATHWDGLPGNRWSPIPVLIWPEKEQLH